MVAFRGGINALVRYLQRCAQRYAPALDRDDLVQNSLLAAIRKGNILEAPWAHQWLTKALRYEALDAAAALRRRPECRPWNVLDKIIGVSTSTLDVDERDTIERLPPNQRKCLLLRMHGWSYPEIATKLRTAPSTVRAHVCLARKQLRKMKLMNPITRGPCNV